MYLYVFGGLYLSFKFLYYCVSFFSFVEYIVTLLSYFVNTFFIIYFILLNFQNLLSFKHTFLTYSKELSSHFPLPYSSSPTTTQKASAGKTETDSLMLVLLAKMRSSIYEDFREGQPILVNIVVVNA